MGEMQESIEDFKKAFAMLARNIPKATNCFTEFMNATLAKGALDTKTKELIALGTAITARCKYCIAIHVQKSLAAGATKDEIIEAAGVAVLMGGGPALTYVAEVKKALDEFAPETSV